MEIALLLSIHFLKTHHQAVQLHHLELSTHPGYMDAFVAACFIPHTDRSLFPNSIQA